ncbi:MAG: choline kinase [Cereibacter sphaeroides]|uniref:Choline kinase n=1 Tax=Cereibacter sphaeroides TaxID=1063 RepID=A0A2W5U3N4_CERSP|nr:MAG: choline kinase [Cereibacter sphaeroides]
MTPPDRIVALPCWQGAILAQPLAGGLSNEIWKVTDGAGAHVVRLGRDYPFHHVYREREAMTARAAHTAGFAPAVEYTEPGVMVTRFITARAWVGDDLRREPERVALMLRDFHDRMGREVSGAGFIFWPFHVIRDYLRTLKNTLTAPQIAEWQALSDETEAAQVPLPVIFGHHDMLPANLLDDGQRLWLIDYEYAGFGTAMFDLAGAASNAGMTAEESDRLLNAYFGQVGPELRRAFDAMQVASLLREMLWSHVSGLYLSAPGVDYAAYADENRARLEAALSHYRSLYGNAPK